MIRDKGKAGTAAEDDNHGGQKHSKSDMPEDQLSEKDKEDLPSFLFVIHSHSYAHIFQR